MCEINEKSHFGVALYCSIFLCIQFICCGTWNIRKLWHISQAPIEKRRRSEQNFDEYSQIVLFIAYFSTICCLTNGWCCNASVEIPCKMRIEENNCLKIIHLSLEMLASDCLCLHCTVVVFGIPDFIFVPHFDCDSRFSL